MNICRHFNPLQNPINRPFQYLHTVRAFIMFAPWSRPGRDLVGFSYRPGRDQVATWSVSFTDQVATRSPSQHLPCRNLNRLGRDQVPTWSRPGRDQVPTWSRPSTDKHHLLVDKRKSSNSIAPNDTPGDLYECLTCHSVETVDNAFEMKVTRDCLKCHPINTVTGPPWRSNNVHHRVNIRNCNTCHSVIGF